MAAIHDVAKDEARNRGLYAEERNKPAFLPFFEQGNPFNFNAVGNYSPGAPGIFEITSANVEDVGASELVINNIMLYMEQTSGTFRVDNYGHQPGLTNGWVLKVFYDGRDDSVFSPAVKTNSEIELGFPNGAGGNIEYAGGGNKVTKYWVDYKNYLGVSVVIRANRNDAIQFVHQDNYGVAYVNHICTALGYFRKENYQALAP